MESVENHKMCSIKESVLIEWQRKLQSISSPTVDFNFNAVEMKDQVIRKSIDLADAILDELEEMGF